MCSQPTFSSLADEGPSLNERAVALLSGGLDSALAIYLVKRQGIDVTAVHFPSFFSPIDPTSADSPVQVLARQLDVPLVLIPKGEDFVDVIRNPKYGYGKNINPCIDCRIHSFIKAKRYMEEIGASFIVTGEVLGQRPMSQRKDAMRMIDKRSGCDGLVLRPLSAKAMQRTLPEIHGVIDRERLLGITGRSRKTQLSLAHEIGLSGYSPPAGGCLLTDPVFARRVRDLLADQPNVSREDLGLLHVGRHIRIRPGLRIVVGRNEEENGRIEELSRGATVFRPVDFPGPVAVALGRVEPEEEILVGSLIRRYARPSSRGEQIAIQFAGFPEREIAVTELATDSWISEHMI